MIGGLTPLHLLPEKKKEKGRRRGEGSSEKEWGRQEGLFLSYGVAQALSGYGCFGEYLYRIGKRGNSDCADCGMRDTAEGTLFQF